MIIRYRQDILISIEFQSKEAVTIYIDHNWIQKQLGLLQCSLSFFFSSFLHEESFTLYILLWIIFTLHLLIIRTLTWVLVPSDTLSGFLWVVVAEVVLFRGLLHINAARKVVSMHLIRWW